ncbi:MAG: serine/threonine protein kinase [Coriobacteriaceae bacterium]|jgi:serine/threonine-protein kinase|nr:serine/threonine protein kinase [Coriobacteriaceae bacterium]
MLQIGTVVEGKYKVLNKIGQGGMSIVYLAMNERANRQWAIKEVRKDGIDSHETMRQSLIAETDMLKKLQHPHLPGIADVIDNGDTLLIVMDYIEGNPLSQAISELGALDQKDVIAWGSQICEVLDYLHSRNPPIIYRDLKPSNIMLKPNGEVVLIDFGTAREFKEGRADDTVALGTQGYAAPEQFGAHQTDARTDIYTLGATMYHLLTGHNPSEPPYVMHPIRHWNPELSSGLEQIIAKCTQRDPDDRYQSAAELLRALERYHELDYEYRLAQNRRLHLFLFALASSAVFLLGSLGFAFAESSQMKSSYSSLINQAQDLASTGTVQEVASLYTQAATLDPTREEAYTEMLRMIKADQDLDEGENQILRRMLNENSGTPVTNIEQFRAGNPAAYDAFAYDLGIAYYFIYDGSGDKGKAEVWLKAAGESTSLGRQKAELAKRLAFIAENYEAFLKGGNAKGGVSSLLSDDEFSPRNYWDEMVALSEGDLTAITGNTFMAIGFYKELVYQLHEHAPIFLGGGISEEEILKQLDKAVSGLRSLIATDPEEQGLIERTLRLANDTRGIVQATAANRVLQQADPTGSLDNVSDGGDLGNVTDGGENR